MSKADPAEGVTHITISPATTNQNLKFAGEFEQAFRATSLAKAFEKHIAFGAVFKTTASAYGRNFRQVSSKSKYRGDIVALSEDLATAETEGKGATPFTLTKAPKGLVDTIMTAYNRHCKLVISPDDVWLTILAQFCAYVNKNAEALRGRVVAHEGQKELEVKSIGTLKCADYRGMIRNLLGEIRANIKSPELADWFRPGFSTTTERDEVCAAATAMASLQAYFTYKMTICCGIPSVTLLGTVADWKLLREKVDRLLEFEVNDNVMEVWVGYLRKVCDGLVESAEHPHSAETLEFWNKVGCVLDRTHLVEITG